jgi:alkylation response protein AidB-like acyl-CoA dehydrogenase
VGQNIVAETAERIFADLADPLTINRAKDTSWKAPLWKALTEAGLPLAWVAEEQGGAGASLAEGFDVLTAAGRFALPVPLVETMLAGWLLGKGGIASPDGTMTVVPTRPKDRITVNADGTLSGTARQVPFANGSEHIAVFAHATGGATIALVKTSACRIVPGESLAGDPRDEVVLDKVMPLKSAKAPAGLDQDAVLLMGGVARSLQIAGALTAALDQAVRYSGERVAFERPIGKFQAVQHNLAKLAGETAAALAAAGSAADTIANADKFDDTVFLEATAAKIRCAEAAEQGAAIAHQVFGAIGFTKEHILHRFTMRALGWRDDFGNESHWALALGRKVAANGADELWPMLAAR